MRCNLDDVLGGIGVGCGKKGDQRLVDSRIFGSLNFFARRIKHIGQARALVFERLTEANQLHRNGGSLWSAKAHNSNATSARRCGDGGDGVDRSAWIGHVLQTV